MAAGISGLLTAAGLVLTLDAQGPAARPPSTGPALFAFVDEYCLSCHDEDKKKGDLALDTVASLEVARHPEVWEKVVRKLRARQMPPVGKDAAGRARPTTRWSPTLETALDRAAAAHPNPGRTATIRRLTRTEYQNAIRDLLALDVDVAALLPPDESSHGFDNVTVGDLSPTLLDRYISAAREDQPAGGRRVRAARPAATRSACRRTSRRRSTSTACRSARAAARSSATRSRRTASTRSRSG